MQGGVVAAFGVALAISGSLLVSYLVTNRIGHSLSLEVRQNKLQLSLDWKILTARRSRLHVEPYFWFSCFSGSLEAMQALAGAFLHQHLQ